VRDYGQGYVNVQLLNYGHIPLYFIHIVQ